jgi:HK97 family phage major capsid protein
VKWYCTSEFWATVLQRLALAAGGVTHAEMEGELRPVFLGKPVELVEVMPHVEANDDIPLLYGNIAQAATFGDRRGVTVKTTDSNDTDFESDLEATKATERFDINVHDVGNASATASLRKAGPVVALLTAAS